MARAKIGVEFDPVVTAKVDRELARLQSQAKGIDFGGGARSLNKLSRPLGKITGQANEFQKSLEASNARVLAFGASVVVINKLNQAFTALVSNTIKVEATFAKINTILGGTQKQLKQFGDGIFKVAKNTATAFDEVAEGALELARQGLSVEESLGRVEVALKLVRVAGIDSQQAVAGLTAAIKGFENAGLTVAQIGDKLAEVDTKFAVSTEDLINGLERASASARVAGVSFDELLAAVTTVQERTQRGGAVIGNAFKTIFARLGRTDTLRALESLGVETLDASGNVRDAIPLFRELATELDKLGIRSVEAGEIIQKVAGVRQRDILINLVEDLNSEFSKFDQAIGVAGNSIGALDTKNAQLNKTLDALIKNLVTSGQQLASILGEVGFLDAAKGIVDGFTTVVEKIRQLLDGEGIGSTFARGLVKGIGNVLTGPGLGLALAIFTKLFLDLAKFGVTSLKSLLGINKATERQTALQQSVLQSLLQNEALQASILKLEGNKLAQEQLLLKVYQQQVNAVAKLAAISKTVTPGLLKKGLRGGPGGVTGKASGGYIASEKRDVNRGVGGATSAAQVVSIPNFAFGGGKRGTMVANTSEYIVPNYAGGGDAIFNQNMVKSMGLPPGARKITAAGGYVPNFAIKPRISLGKSGITSPEAARQAGYTESQIASRFGKQGTRATTRAAAAKKKNKGVLNMNAGGKIGVASIFPGVTNASTFTSVLSGPERAILKSKYPNTDITGVRLNNVQVKSLEKVKKNLKSERADRNIISKFFAEPAYNYGASLLDFFSGDEKSKTLNAMKKRSKGPSLFSSSVMGGIFESAIKLVTGGAKAIPDFDSALQDQTPFDFEEGGPATSRFNTRFGFSPAVFKADAKRTAGPDAVRSTIGKSIRDRSVFNMLPKTIGRAIGGFIPNYADPLSDAINREAAAGVPINQIRVNQSGKLRNSANPGGIAVTNTRDEPTGAIPNFVAPAALALPAILAFLKANTLRLVGMVTTTSVIDMIANKVAPRVAPTFTPGGAPSNTAPFNQPGKTDITGKRKFKMPGVGGLLSNLTNIAILFSVLKGQFDAFFPGDDQGDVGGDGDGDGGRDPLGGGPTGPTPQEIAKRARQRAQMGADATKFFGSRQRQINLIDQRKINDLQTELAITKNLTEEQKVLKQFEIDKLEAAKDLKMKRLDNFNTLVKTAVEAQNLGEAEKEKLMTLLKNNENLKDEETLRKEITEKFKLGSEAADKLAKEAIEIKTATDEEHANRMQNLALTKDQEQSVARANDLEAEKLSTLKKQTDQLQKQENLSSLRSQLAMIRRDEFVGAEGREMDVLDLESKADRDLLKEKRNRLTRESEAEQRLKTDANYSIEEFEADMATIRKESALTIQVIKEQLAKDIEDASRTPLEQYIRENQQDVKRFSDELPARMAQNFETNMNSALNGLRDGTYDTLGEALGQVAINFGEQLLQELQSRAIKNATAALFDGGEGGSGGGGGGLGNFLQKGFKFVANLFSGGDGGTETLNSGGMVRGGGGVIDDVPAMLTGGEYVVRRSAVQKYGVGFLNSLNSGTIQGFNQGGEVSKAEREAEKYKATARGISGVFGKRLGIDPFEESYNNFRTVEENLAAEGGATVQGADNIRTTKFFLSGDQGLYDAGQMFGGTISNQRLEKARNTDFFMPGDRGFGSIVGKENLLAFSQQSTTSGSTDLVGQGRINLELQSARLSPLGRQLAMQSPAGQRLQESQQLAYQLAMQAKANEEFVIAENDAARTARREAFQNSIKNAAINAVVTAGFDALGNSLNNNTTPTAPGLESGTAPNSVGGGSIGTGGGSAGSPGYGYSSPGTGYMDGNTYVLPDYNVVAPKGPSFQRKSGPPGKMLGGASGGTQSALLSEGEFVMDSQTASSIGKPTLDAINELRYAQGGPVGSVGSGGSRMGGSKADVENVNITINIDKEGNADASTDIEDNTQQAREFSKKVKDVVLNVINEEKRVSGSLFTRSK